MGVDPLRSYCTYFDSGYLTRALALIESLRAVNESFRLFVLCMDDECLRTLRALSLPEVEPIALGDFEAWDPEVAATKATRSRIEYYFTCSPALPLYVLAQRAEIDRITYLDADLYFFANPQPIFEEIGEAPVAIIEHRYPPAIAHLADAGKFNVGFLSFRRSEVALACLRWWREKCVEWCRDEPDGERYADQKYLDQWPSLFPDCRQIAHEGANVAPWNVGRFAMSLRQGRVYVDDVPLIFYHFHGLKSLTPFIFDPQLQRYAAQLSPVLRKDVYGPYLAALHRAEQTLARRAPRGARTLGSIRASAAARRSFVDEWRRKASDVLRGTLRGRLIYAVRGRLV
jgi:hypothetical protein